jgi:DNA topoisomerase 2-associated protein PAT1
VSRTKEATEHFSDCTAVRPSGYGQQGRSGPPPPGQIKTLDEIEAEMTAMDFNDARGPAAPPLVPAQPQVRSLEDIEREMMGEPEPAPRPPQPPRVETPVQPAFANSGYASQQALLDSMFPQLGEAPPPPIPGQRPSPMPTSIPGGPQPGQQMSPEQIAQAQALHERITAKIKAMSTYNNCMGASDKDFITRIQLSQLATADPYTSDFYAQVYSAIHKARQPDAADGPTVVKVGQDAGFGVGGPTGNRFGQMGNKTMQKLSSQVKKLVEQRRNKQMSNGEFTLRATLCERSLMRQTPFKVPLGVLPEQVSLRLDLF